MSQTRQIALAFPRGAHQELFIEGVCRYAAENDCDWTYTVSPESLSLSLLELEGWPGDGVLAAVNTPEEARCAAGFAIPVVNVSSALADSPVPRSMVDNETIGKLAAEHLLSRGFKNLAFYGLAGVEFSKRRWLGFVSHIEESGFTGLSTAQHLTTPTFRFDSNAWMKQNQQLSEWLVSLPKPCGILAVSDYRSRYVLDSCQQTKIESPEQISVIGVDNEPFICEHVSPTLTSVARNNMMEGYRAAEMLDQLIRGFTLESQETLVPPLEVVERQSTAAFAVSDPRLRMVLAYLHDYLEDPITVEEMASHAGVSRRWLEYAFRDAFGETPYQYIRRQRLQQARRLLSDEPRVKIVQVAQRTGFASVKQMRLAFLQAYGTTPGECRRQMLQHDDAATELQSD